MYQQYNVSEFYCCDGCSVKSFFRSLFGKRLVRHPDAFALTRVALWNSIAASIRLQQSLGKAVWLVAHFQDTFSDCQTMLEQHGLEYLIESDPLTEDWFREHADDAGSRVHLLLADLATPLPDMSQTGDEDVQVRVSYRIAMLVAERHPFGPRDEELVQFAISLPARVEIGYYLAMEDELVKRTVPPQIVELMKTMGLQDQDLISRSMVTKRLRRFIRKGSQASDVAGDAESATQWYSMQEK